MFFSLQPRVTLSISKRSLSHRYNYQKYTRSVQGSGKVRERKILFLCGVNSDSPKVLALQEAAGPSCVAKLLCMADYPGYFKAGPCPCKECAL